MKRFVSQIFAAAIAVSSAAMPSAGMAQVADQAPGGGGWVSSCADLPNGRLCCATRISDGVTICGFVTEI